VILKGINDYSHLKFVYWDATEKDIPLVTLILTLLFITD
jgi:hypothetical protein